MSKRTPLSFNVTKVIPVQASVAKTEQTGFSANTQTVKQSNKTTKKGRDGRQFIAAHVVPESAKQFKLLVVQQGSTTQDMLVEAINDLFAKYNLSRIAE